jgi:hypothetical protein
MAAQEEFIAVRIDDKPGVDATERPGADHRPLHAGAGDKGFVARYGGQIYPAPIGLLKQPTDSGSSSFGR